MVPGRTGRLHARAGLGLHGHSSSFAADLTATERDDWLQLVADWQPPIIDTAVNYHDAAGKSLYPWLARLLEAMRPARPRIINKIGGGWTPKDGAGVLCAAADAITKWVQPDDRVEVMLYTAPSLGPSDLRLARNALADGGHLLTGLSVVLPCQLEVIEEAGFLPGVLQFPFNPVDGQAGLEFLGWCRRHGVQSMARSMLASGLLGDTPWGWEVPLTDPLRQRFWAKAENEAILGARLAARSRISGFLADNWAEGLARHGFAACTVGLTLGHPDLDVGLLGGRAAGQTARLCAVLGADMPESVSARFWAEAPAWQAPFFC